MAQAWVGITKTQWKAMTEEMAEVIEQSMESARRSVQAELDLRMADLLATLPPLIDDPKEDPHADGDFSKTCGSPWCKCMS